MCVFFCCCFGDSDLGYFVLITVFHMLFLRIFSSDGTLVCNDSVYVTDNMHSFSEIDHDPGTGARIGLFTKSQCRPRYQFYRDFRYNFYQDFGQNLQHDGTKYLELFSKDIISFVI